MRRVFAILAWGLLVPFGAWAHTDEMLGGRLVAHADGLVELRLEISSNRLPVFAGELPGAFRHWDDVRGKAPWLAACFQESLRVYSEGREVPPSEVVFPQLATDEVASGAAGELPDFVTVSVFWRGLPFMPGVVIPRFDLNEVTVTLILDDTLGGNLTPPAENPARGAAQSWRRVGRAIVVGYEHIVPEGLDHILFVLGLFFAARRFRDLFWQVTMFTVAHSITLGLAMTGVVALAAGWSRAVEIGIAISIVAVAVENCLVRQRPGGRRLLIIGAFGLIHGLGFAGALQEVNWPADHFLAALVAANVGIELGQLTVIAVAALLVAWVWPRPWYRARIAIPASMLIGACGLYWAVERTLGAFAG